MNRAWESFNRLVRDCETGEIVCEVEATHKKVAPLIAAAPDLLEACQQVMAWAKTPGKHGGNPYLLQFVVLAEAAVAKATGGEK